VVKQSAHVELARQARAKGGDYASPVAQINEEAPYEFDPNETYHEIVYNEAWKGLRSPEYRAYRKQWDEVPRNKVELPFPIHLDIETTNICNLRCPMCPRTVLMANDEFSPLGSITQDEYRRMIDEGVEHGLKSIKLNYLGEPMAHPDVVWQVAYAKEKGVLDVMMNSNGTLLNDRMAKDLLAAGLDNLFISFDAVNPADYEVQRIGTSMGKVIDNVYNFIKLRNERRPECQVRISMVMYREPKWMEQFEAMKVMWKGLVDAIGYGYYVERDRNRQGEFPEIPGFHCAQPFQRMFLKYNGNATICCVDDKDETIVGNWREQSLHEIWNGPAYKEIRRLHGTGCYYKMSMCRKCYLPVSS
jgi:radical SAM protein with 4Fe4S-binding SPASM domain